MEKTELGFVDLYIKETEDALKKWDEKLNKFNEALAGLRRECEEAPASFEGYKEQVEHVNEVDESYSESRMASEKEWEIFTLQNKLRTQPTSFIPYIKNQLNLFVGRVMYTPDGRRVITEEGAPAWQEALDTLNAATPL